MTLDTKIRIFVPPVIAILAYAVVYISSFFEQETFSWIVLAWHIVDLYVVWEICRWVNGKLDQRYSWGKHLGKRIGIQITLSTLLSVAYLDFSYLAIKSIFIVYFQQDDSISWIHLTVATSTAILQVIFILFLQLSIHAVEQWKQKALESAYFERESLNAQYQALHNQVNPHFLFNTLNTLYGLIHESPDIAAEHTLKLADIYRYVLQSQDHELVSLGEELDFLEAYLFLETTRFGEALSFEIQLHPSDRVQTLPPLTLQLLAENAVKHNVLTTQLPLFIRVFREGEWLVMENTLRPRTQPQPSTGMGLANIQKRYAYFVDRPLQIRAGDGFFRVALPLLGTNPMVNSPLPHQVEAKGDTRCG